MLLQTTFADKLPVILTPSALILAGLIYLWLRAESLHHIRLRILRLFVSRRDLRVRSINQQIAEDSSLFAFRFNSGIKAETLADAESVIAFAKAKNLPLSLIGRAGRAFNINTLDLREKSIPARWHSWFFFALAIVFFTFAVIFAGFATKKEFMTSLTETGTKLWLTNDRAIQREGLRAGEATIAKEDLCASTASTEGHKAVGWPSVRDREILCEVFKDPEFSKLLDDEVKTQRRVATLIAAWAAALGTLSLYLLTYILAVFELAKRIKKDAPGLQQTSHPKPQRRCIHLSLFCRCKDSAH